MWDTKGGYIGTRCTVGFLMPQTSLVYLDRSFVEQTLTYLALETLLRAVVRRGRTAALILAVLGYGRYFIHGLETQNISPRLHSVPLSMVILIRQHCAAGSNSLVSRLNHLWSTASVE